MKTVHGDSPPVNTSDTEVSPKSCCHQCGDPSAFLARLNALQERWYACRLRHQAAQVDGDRAVLEVASAEFEAAWADLLRFKEDAASMFRMLWRWSEFDERGDCPIRETQDRISAVESGRDDHAHRIADLETALCEEVLS